MSIDIDRKTSAPTSDVHFDIGSVDDVVITLKKTAKHTGVFAPYTYTHNTYTSGCIVSSKFNRVFTVSMKSLKLHCRSIR